MERVMLNEVKSTGWLSLNTRAGILMQVCQSEPKNNLGGGAKNQHCSECPETHFGFVIL